MRKILPIAVVVTFIVSILAAPTITLAQHSLNSDLKAMGINIPEQNVLKNIAGVYNIEFRNIQLVTLGGKWTLVKVPGAPRYTTAPGYPSLPYRVITVTLNGYAKNVHVYVSVQSFETLKVSKPVVPAPTPVMIGAPSMLNKSALFSKFLKFSKPRIVANESVYHSNAFYPGAIVKVRVAHGLHGKTLIFLYVSPVQYNPATSTLIFVKKLSIVVSYGSIKEVKYNPKGLLILTTEKLLPYVNKYLVPIYKQLGYQVTVVTTEYIWKHYKPAPPITEYPGYYSFLMAAKSGAPVAGELIPWYIQQYYNATLALKIIQFLRQTLGNYSYMLIVGGAREVPPSFYYFSYMEFRYVSLYDAWIPTDIFYASPDYDLIPNIYVGRLPFDNGLYIEIYAKKLETWYKTLPERKPLIVLGGGFPFLITYMFGESFIEKLVDEGVGKAPVMVLSQSEGTFNPNTIGAVLSGKTGAMLFLAVAHGDGYGLYEPTLWWVNQVSWETLAFSTELMSFKPTTNYTVVMSVACRDGWWDTDIMPVLKYEYIIPPKYPFWEAVLLSPAAGVAYIGAARINWDYVWIQMTNGTLSTQSYGATGLLGDMLLAYTSMIGKASNVTLGSIFWRGMVAYYKSSYPVVPGMTIQEIMLNALLGDPTIALKLPSKPVNRSTIYSVKAVNPVKMYDFSSILGYPLSAPLYLATEPGKVAINATKGCYTVQIYREWNLGIYDNIWSLYLIWLQKVGEKTFCLNKSGVYILTLNFTADKSGLLLLRIIGKNYYYRFYLGALGVKTREEMYRGGSRIIVSAYGLDLLGLQNLLGITVGDRVVAEIHTPLNGFINYTLTLPYLGPGKHTIGIKIIRPAVGFGYLGTWLGPSSTKYAKELESILKTTIEVYATYPLSIKVSVPSSVAVNTQVPITIITTVQGKPVSAKLSAYIVLPSGSKVPLHLTEQAVGVYTATFTPSSTGMYTIVVNGSVEPSATLPVYAHGYVAKGFVAIEKLYTLASYLSKQISSSTESITATVKTSVSTLSDQLNKVESTLTSTIKASANSVTSSVLSALKSSVSSLESSIASAKSDVLSAIQTSTNTIVSKVSSTVESSTSKVLAAISSAQSSLSSKISAVESSISSLSSTVSQISQGVKSIQGELTTISNKITTSTNELKTTITSAINSVKSTISSSTAKILNSISSSMSQVKSEVSSVKSSIEPLAAAATALSAICLGLIGATLALVARKK